MTFYDEEGYLRRLDASYISPRDRKARDSSTPFHNHEGHAMSSITHKQANAMQHAAHNEEYASSRKISQDVAAAEHAENVALGLKAGNFSFPLHRVERRVRELAAKYQLQVNPRARVKDLSAGEQQRVELIKVLYHDPQVLLLDEPTSLLTSGEAQKLFAVLREMAAEGKGIVFITHKMEEVFQVSDRITVLKLGKTMGTQVTSQTSREALSRLIFGEQEPLQLEREPVSSEQLSLQVKGLQALGPEGTPALKGISFDLRVGEILGIAGVAGNGQSELVEVITGLRRATGGQALLGGVDYTHCPSRKNF